MTSSSYDTHHLKIQFIHKTSEPNNIPFAILTVLMKSKMILQVSSNKMEFRITWITFFGF